MFAKLFESEKYGQILVKKDTNDDGDPELRFYFSTPHTGVCSVAMVFPDTEDGHDGAEKGLEITTLDSAEGMVSSAVASIEETIPGLLTGGDGGE